MNGVARSGSKPHLLEYTRTLRHRRGPSLCTERETSSEFGSFVSREPWAASSRGQTRSLLGDLRKASLNSVRGCSMGARGGREPFFSRQRSTVCV